MVLNILKYVKESDEVTREVYGNLIHSFLQNGQGHTRYALSQLLINTDWYSYSDAYKYILRTLKPYIIDKRYFFVVYKKNYDASSFNLISTLTSQGNFGAKRIIDITEIDNYEFDNDRIPIVIDDFIGTGNTIYNEAINKITANKILVCFHTLTATSYDRLNSDPRIQIIVSNPIIIKPVLSKITNRYVINYINKVCQACIKPDFSFGYGGLGLSINYNGVTPNNTLSLLWYNGFSAPYQNWIPIFNRNLNAQVMNDIVIDTVKNKALINQWYLKNKANLWMISEIQYKILICVRLLLYDVKTMKNILLVDSYSDFIKIIKKTKKDGLLFINGNQVVIRSDIKAIIDKDLAEHIKEYRKNL